MTDILAKEKIEAYVEELLNGKGYFILPQLFSDEEIKVARDLIHLYSNVETNNATHFQGKNEDKIQLQRRVWNLLNKGDIFVKMVQHPILMQIGRASLGDEFCLGSIAVNRLLPGGPGQEAHIDYPYWDMYKVNSFPINVTPAFPMNLQVTVMLDDFTVENGATVVWPGSQKECRYPTEEDTKKNHRKEC
ncbi:MAG: phytanoyl-CoA dioxygenase family protein [Bacteroidota bacterium]